MIGKRKLSVLMVSWILAGYVGAGAQELTSGAMEPDTDPVKLSVTLMGDYTDNRDSSAIAESTFNFYFQARIDAVASWAADGSAVFYYAPTYRYQTDPSVYQNKNQLLHALGLDLRHGVSDTLKLRLLEAFNYTDDPSVQQFGETLRSDASFILNTLEAGVTYVFSRRSNIDLYGRNMIKRYSEQDVAKDSDEDSVGGGATLWGQVNKEVALLAEAQMTDYSYESSLGLERGFSSTAGGVGLEGRFSPNFGMGVRAGLQVVEYDDSSLESDTVPYGSVDAMVSPMPATRFTAGVSYMIRKSDVYPFASQKSTDVTAGLEWDAVPSRLMVALSGTYRQGEYTAESIPASSSAVGSSSGNRDAVLGTLQATFKVDNATSVRLAQSYEDVSSDVNDSFTKNTTTLAVSRVF